MNKSFPIFILLMLAGTSLVSAAAVFDPRYSPLAQEPVGIDCTTTGVGYPPGTTVTMICPEGCERRAFYGDGTYSDDSSVCSAAAHMGAIDLARGGTVTIQVTEGLSEYVSATRNGLTSNASTGSRFAYQVIGGSSPAATGNTSVQGETPEDAANKEAACKLVELQQSLLTSEATRFTTELQVQTQTLEAVDAEIAASLDAYVQCQGSCEMQLFGLAVKSSARTYVQGQVDALTNLIKHNGEAQENYQSLRTALSCAA